MSLIRGRLDKSEMRLAVRLGRGAGLRQIMRSEPGRYDRLIQDVVLKYWGWDRQVEADRTWYIQKLFDQHSRRAQLRRRVLDRLLRSRDHRTRDQLVLLADSWARRGDVRARKIVERAVGDGTLLYSETAHQSWLRRRGFTALLMTVRAWARRRDRVSRGDECDFTRYARAAGAGRGGARAMRARLEARRKSDPLVDRYLKWLERERIEIERERSVSYPPRLPPTLEQLAARIAADPLKFPGVIAAFARGLAPDDQARLVDRLAAEHSPRVLGWLWCFRMRHSPVPVRLHPRLLELAADPDVRIASAACVAMRAFGDPRVREATLSLIAREPSSLDHSAMVGLGAALKREDDAVLFASLSRLMDREQIHGADLGFDWLATLRPGVPLPRCWKWLADHTPCSHCRAGWMRELLAHGELSKDDLRDAAFDCSAGIRAIARRKPGLVAR